MMHVKRKQDEERRQEEEARRLRQIEKRKLEGLQTQLASWQQAVLIRRKGGIEPGSPLEKWILWAEGKADATDPTAATAETLVSRPSAPAAN